MDTTRAATRTASEDPASALPPELLRRMYMVMVLARTVDKKMWALNRQGKAPFVISGQGHEAAQAGIAYALKSGYDFVAPYYRDLTLCLALGMTTQDFMLSVFAKRDDPASGGRQMPSHFGSSQLRIMTGSSPVATQMLHAAGAALAFKVRGEDRVAIGICGEGGSSEGDWHEAHNFAAVHRLPVVFVVENNHYAISVPLAKQMAVTSVTARAAGYGMRGVNVDGGDPIAVHLAAREAVGLARQGGGPTLLDVDVARFTSHSSDDDQRRYRSADELEAMLRRDPIQGFAQRLLRLGVISTEQIQQIQQEAAAEVDEAVAMAETAAPPEAADIHRHVYAEAVSGNGD